MHAYIHTYIDTDRQTDIRTYACMCMCACEYMHACMKCTHAYTYIKVLDYWKDEWRPLPEFASMGIFWWNGQLLAYIFAPNAHLESLVRAAKSAIGFRGAVLGE